MFNKKRHIVLDEAFKLYGEKEIPGQQHNPDIVRIWTALKLNITDDETPWCAAFVNYCLNAAGIPGTKKANARSFESWGVETKNPMPGDIAVFWRGSPGSWKGHVAFFIREDGNYVWVLGGNQSNMVQISQYSKDRILSYRTYA